MAAKLRFFEGDAWRIYGQTIRPALLRVTQREIEMTGDEVTGGAAAQPKPALKPGDLTERFKKMRQLPNYLDNNIQRVSYSGDSVTIQYKRLRPTS